MKLLGFKLGGVIDPSFLQLEDDSGQSSADHRTSNEQRESGKCFRSFTKGSKDDVWTNANSRVECSARNSTASEGSNNDSEADRQPVEGIAFGS